MLICVKWFTDFVQNMLSCDQTWTLQTWAIPTWALNKLGIPKIRGSSEVLSLCVTNVHWCCHLYGFFERWQHRRSTFTLDWFDDHGWPDRPQWPRCPPRLVLLSCPGAGSAFFWLVSLLFSSLLWFAVVPLRSELSFGMVFSVLLQELFRCGPPGELDVLGLGYICDFFFLAFIA